MYLWTVYYFQQNFKKKITINPGQVIADTGHDKTFSLENVLKEFFYKLRPNVVVAAWLINDKCLLIRKRLILTLPEQ